MAASEVEVLPANEPRPLSDLSKRALAYYRENLQIILEAEHEGEGVAIHPDTGDYVVAKTPTQASRTMRSRHPADTFVTMRIGPGPDYSLVSRLIAGRMMPEQPP